MQIFVKSFTGKTIMLDVQPSDSIGSLKEKLKETHSLTFCGKTLESNRTLSDYQIGNKSVLHLVHCGGMQIFVKTTTGETIMLEVDPLDTIESVMTKIQDRQHFTCAGRLLDNSKQLSDYSVKENSSLQLTFRNEFQREYMKIVIKFLSAKEILLDVEACETIRNVKARIEAKDNIPVEQQRLFFNKEHMEDDHTLSHYKIKEGSILMLILSFSSSK